MIAPGSSFIVAVLWHIICSIYLDMLFSTAFAVAVAALSGGATANRVANFQKHVDKYRNLVTNDESSANVKMESRAESATTHRFLNKKTMKFAVNGAKLPDIPFDMGESYAGSLPISENKGQENNLFFWFFPSEDGSITDEITVWLNGGPGCSSLSGFMTENGPALWQDGTLAPIKNPYSWHKLTNMIWIEQPVGTGFSLGTPSVTDEVALAAQFRGFWKNFINTFDQLKGAKTYLTGESYAGAYVPYIANSFLLQNNTEYFNLKGISINDPVIGDEGLQFSITDIPYNTYWANLINHSEETIAEINERYEASGQANYTRKWFTFPPPQEPFPKVPEADREAEDLISKSIRANNPCFNVYHISDQCPYVYGHLGSVTTGGYAPPGAEVYFQRADVQKAIHAPLIGDRWQECGGNSDKAPLPEDNSPGAALDGTLQNIIELTNNAIVGSGALDALLQTNGTLFALQNVTWNGHQGFHSFPKTPFFVPEHKHESQGAKGPSGNIGVYVKERGLTFYDVQLAGHEVPGYSLSGGYRMLQQLLGRIEDLSSTKPLF